MNREITVGRRFEWRVRRVREGRGLSWGLSSIGTILILIGAIGAVDASPRPRRDPDLDRADIVVMTVLAMEAHLARVCGRAFDRDRWFERVMADRVAQGVPATRIRAAREFWPRFVEIYDVRAETRGVNVCSAEVSVGFENALARLRRDFPE